MGKTTRTYNSDHSMRSYSDNRSRVTSKMSTQKIKKAKRRNRNRTKKNIRKVFDNLRRQESTSSIDTVNSMIILDDTVLPSNDYKSDETLSATSIESKKQTSSRKSIVIDEAGTPSNKRKFCDVLDDNQSKKRKASETLVSQSKNSKCNISDPSQNKSQHDLSVVVIDDTLTPKNKPCSSSTPLKPKPSTVQCSTPIHKNNSQNLQDLIVSNFPNSNSNKNLNDEITDLTKEINPDSFVTIDLTRETLNNSASKTQNTVIDLVDASENNDCMMVSVSNTSLSLSGESEVTVLNCSSNKSAHKEMRKVFKGISKLDAEEKSKMLELVVKQILNGCNVPESLKQGLKVENENQQGSSGTVEDAYIREVILGQSQSRNSIGSNIYNPEQCAVDSNASKGGLRMVIVDGSNVAMEHGKGKMFSVKGLKICIDYFLKRGHVVKAFVPRFRCKFGKSTNPKLLDELERQGLVVYTPSREIQGKTVTSYDDRYIVQCAAVYDGVIVSGDNYRDLLAENPRWRYVIENRLLPFTWVNDMIMFPRDPLGRHGPTLEQFLKHTNHAKPN